VNVIWFVNDAPKHSHFARFSSNSLAISVLRISCILMMRHDDILSFLHSYFHTNLLTHIKQSFCVFLYGIYVFLSGLMLSIVNQKLICFIWFLSRIILLDLHNDLV
jgi:hypothetical protein